MEALVTRCVAAETEAANVNSRARSRSAEVEAELRLMSSRLSESEVRVMTICHHDMPHDDYMTGSPSPRCVWPRGHAGT